MFKKLCSTELDLKISLKKYGYSDNIRCISNIRTLAACDLPKCFLIDVYIYELKGKPLIHHIYITHSILICNAIECDMYSQKSSLLVLSSANLQECPSIHKMVTVKILQYILITKQTLRKLQEGHVRLRIINWNHLYLRKQE